MSLLHYDSLCECIVALEHTNSKFVNDAHSVLPAAPGREAVAHRPLSKHGSSGTSAAVWGSRSIEHRGGLAALQEGTSDFRTPPFPQV